MAEFSSRSSVQRVARAESPVAMSNRFSEGAVLTSVLKVGLTREGRLDVPCWMWLTEV